MWLSASRLDSVGKASTCSGSRRVGRVCGGGGIGAAACRKIAKYCPLTLLKCSVAPSACSAGSCHGTGLYTSGSARRSWEMNRTAYVTARAATTAPAIVLLGNQAMHCGGGVRGGEQWEGRGGAQRRGGSSGGRSTQVRMRRYTAQLPLQTHHSRSTTAPRQPCFIGTSVHACESCVRRCNAINTTRLQGRWACRELCSKARRLDLAIAANAHTDQCSLTATTDFTLGGRLETFAVWLSSPQRTRRLLRHAVSSSKQAGNALRPPAAAVTRAATGTMSGLWLHLGHLENMETSLTKFDSVVAEDALTLEGLRVLGLRREQSVGRECLRLEENATLANHIAKMEEYLAILTAFTSTTKHSGPVSRAGFRWSSALSSLPPSSHFGLDSALAEQIMALSFYAALLQERAYELANQLLRAGSVPSSPAAVPGAGGGGSGRSSPDRRRTSEHRAVGLRRWSYSPSKEGGPAENGAGAAGSGGADDSGEAFAQVAALYRRAAGAFRHIDQQLFEAAAASGLPSDRPVELWEGAAAAMEALCLAQAQGVVAHRAELKGTSAPLVAALYTGAAGGRRWEGEGGGALPACYVLSRWWTCWRLLAALHTVLQVGSRGVGGGTLPACCVVVWPLLASSGCFTGPLPCPGTTMLASTPVPVPPLCPSRATESTESPPAQQPHHTITRPCVPRRPALCLRRPVGGGQRQAAGHQSGRPQALALRSRAALPCHLGHPGPGQSPPCPGTQAPGRARAGAGGGSPGAGDSAAAPGLRGVREGRGLAGCTGARAGSAGAAACCL